MSAENVSREIRIALISDRESDSYADARRLTESGFDCRAFNLSGEPNPEWLTKPFDVLLLRVAESNIGLNPAIRMIREHHGKDVPIMLLASEATEESVVDALDAGADDYMIQPLRLGELAARLRALLRRARSKSQSVFAQSVFEFGPYRFDMREERVWLFGQPVLLTQKEFSLALAVFRKAGQPMARTDLYESVWNGRPLLGRTLDTHMSRIRTKLGLGREGLYRLQLIYGYGYRLDRTDVPAEATVGV